MYWIIDGMCFLAGVAEIIVSLTRSVPIFCLIGICWIIVYPIILESLYNLVAHFWGERMVYSVEPRSRFVYHADYNLTFCGLQKLHPFDASKYGRIFDRLLERGVLQEYEPLVPNKPTRNFLLEKMSQCYLLKLSYSIGVCRYIELPLIFIPAFLLRWRVLNPMLLATQGTILAACLAKKLKWAINLSGGFHHASFNSGGGFCIYPDISLAVHYIQTRMSLQKVMVIDLDAHQGNGHERDHVIKDNVYTVDFYNHNIYPNDVEAKEGIRKDVKVTPHTNDHQFLAQVQNIQEDIDYFHPQFVIYNAGTDILQNDPLGRLHLSPQTIIKRDEIIIGMCLKHQIPVIMVLSGGYQRANADIIANSIENLMQKFN